MFHYKTVSEWVKNVFFSKKLVSWLLKKLPILQVVLIEIKLANYLFNVNIINFISHQQDLGIYFAMALNDHTGMIKRQIVNACGKQI